MNNIAASAVATAIEREIFLVTKKFAWLCAVASSVLRLRKNIHSRKKSHPVFVTLWTHWRWKASKRRPNMKKKNEKKKLCAFIISQKVMCVSVSERSFELLHKIHYIVIKMRALFLILTTVSCAAALFGLLLLLLLPANLLFMDIYIYGIHIFSICFFRNVCLVCFSCSLSFDFLDSSSSCPFVILFEGDIAYTHTQSHRFVHMTRMCHCHCRCRFHSLKISVCIQIFPSLQFLVCSISFSLFAALFEFNDGKSWTNNTDNVAT